MLDRLAQRIHDEVYCRFYNYKTTVFLCGASSKSINSVRQQIDHELTTKWFSFQYDMFYPEDLFGELLYGSGSHNLMTLENILADSVDVIVLAIESYGAVAELGTFANIPKLRKKLVCVVDKQFKKQKSFINYGPLRLIRSTKEGQIIYGDYQNVVSIMERIRRAISIAKREKSKITNVNNVVQAHHFILPSIHLLQPVLRETLIELVLHASKTDIQTSTALTSGALSILNRKREVELSPDGYKLTAAGMKHFEALGRRSRTISLYKADVMDQLRVGIINWQYRGKPLKV